MPNLIEEARREIEVLEKMPGHRQAAAIIKRLVDYIVQLEAELAQERANMEAERSSVVEAMRDIDRGKG